MALKHKIKHNLLTQIFSAEQKISKAFAKQEISFKMLFVIWVLVIKIRLYYWYEKVFNERKILRIT